ncbi:MAG: phosphate--acyl-ACP acyltransferase [Bacteroidales bacterium]|jgi:glycerol-3-phosphate acyltransferase PlsX|nr:phosphate--acyl-ACP acyltransferase [Bacteroidales bacterium]MDD4384891.1 phosphate--acyl-ACP acyltransferase [Bacteroidales bacterium]MDY0197019.1 phosphate--acyl-ACP acyltransferase [Tenuifilaceae bacterium]
MRIGVDAMGGDFAPEATVKGAILAKKVLLANEQIVLFGDKEQIVEQIVKQNGSATDFEIVHCTEVIGMGEHPAKAFSKKQDSSITVGFKWLAQNKIDGFASAGNTGAMLVGTMYTVKSVPGIIRPAIASYIPSSEDKFNLLLDVGINPDCRPDVLYQYGILGSLYAKIIFNNSNPRVALLNIGEEEEKGNLVTKSTFELMKDNTDFNFVGNVEGNMLFNNDKADVIVCDGFVGNVILKEAEAFYHLLKKRKITDPFFERFNFENYGGTPIIGVNAPVIIGHGVSNEKAIMNMILQTRTVISTNLCNKIKEAFS